MVAESPVKPMPEVDGRMLAEAVRFMEEAHGAVGAETEADAVARDGGGDFEARLIRRAAAHPAAAGLREALGRLHGAVGLAVAGGMAAAALAGGTTAAVVFDRAPVNVFTALASLLGVHAVAFLFWLAVMLVRPRSAAAGVLGAALMALGRRLAARLRGPTETVAAARAAAAALAAGGVARWTVSAISHAVWLSFLGAALAAAVALLATRQVTFVWETTILGADDYVAATHVLAGAPAALGFATPDAAQITASERGSVQPPVPGADAAWSGFLLGSLAVYGVAPRVLAFIVCWMARRRALGRWRLDTAQPGYAALRPRLLPTARTTGVLAPAPEAAPAPPPPPEAPGGLAGSGPVAVLGLEIAAPASGWPPAVDGVDLRDLGLIDDGAGRQRAAAALRAMLPPPRAIVAVCDLTATPDRGVCHWLRDLVAGTDVPPALLLTAGERLRVRSGADRVAQRVDDWRRLAADAGVAAGHVLEADLDHLTAASAARLVHWLGGGDGAAADGGAILDRALAVIAEHAAHWPAPPDEPARARLHADIAALYRATRPDWTAWLGLPNLPRVPTLEDVRGGATRLTELLPARLRASPRWLAAGAAAGALGCFAAALLAAPAAAAALPLWVGVGAAVAAVAGPSAAPAPEIAAPPADLGEAVAAAALFTLVLHLQGRGEAAIARIIDRTLPDPEPPALADAAAVRAWLAGVRIRLAAVEAEERV